MAMQRIQNSQITKLKDLLLGCQVFFMVIVRVWIQGKANTEACERQSGAQKHSFVLFLASWNGRHYRTRRRRRPLCKRSTDNWESIWEKKLKLDPRLLLIQKHIAGVCRSKWKRQFISYWLWKSHFAVNAPLILIGVDWIGEIEPNELWWCKIKA